MKKVLKNNRIVVFVDDLDRCSPDKAREVFESIKVFLDIEGFVFIIGLSPEVIKKLISEPLEKMGVTGEQYLQKIIQTTIQIPEWDDYAIGDLISKFSAKLDVKYSSSILEEDNKELIVEGVEQNPRQAKRFVNRLIVALSANPSLDAKSILLNEALNTKWHSFYQDMNTNMEFRKLVKEYAQKPENERLEDLKSKQRDKGKQAPELKKYSR